MRKPQYMSPSSLAAYENDRSEYYLRYLCDDRPDKIPQTKPMSIGSAFDARAKSYIFTKLFGNIDPRFELETLFKAQVEPQNQLWAWEESEYLFNEYIKLGALSDIMTELDGCVGKPRFEFEIRATINGVPLLGKPDISFTHKCGVDILNDWKVNGYCSASPTSPKKGYIRCRPGNKSHKDCMPHNMSGVLVNIGCFFEDVDKQWADQLATYSWLMGENVGTQNIIGVDQICGTRGNIRVASHRCRVSADYQKNLAARYAAAWEVINSDHFFRELSKEESEMRCAMLQRQASALRDAGEDFKLMTRGN